MLDTNQTPNLTVLPKLERVPDGGALELPIACYTRTRVYHEERGDTVPTCTWTRDATAGGYACRECGKWVPVDDIRHDEIATQFGDG